MREERCRKGSKEQWKEDAVVNRREMDDKEEGSGWCGKRERREKRRGRSRREYEGSSKREVGMTAGQK